MLASSGTERQSFASLFLDQTQFAEGLPAAARHIDRIVDVGIVIPVYNGREMIEELCDRLILSASRITEDFSIVLVDDRSGDNVWPVIVALGKRDARIHGIQLSRNFGQHCALTAGIDHVRARWYIVMDCDLQDLPEDIERLFTKALDGYDVVVATHDKAGHLAIKRQSSRLFYWLFNVVSSVDLDWNVGNYRIFSDKVAESFRSLREEERFLPAAFSWMGFEVGKVQLEHRERKAGVSSYSFSRLFRLASNVVIAHSELPLRIVTLFGFVMSVMAIGIAAVYFFKALIGGTPVVGWTSLVVGIFVLGSIQIFMLGVVGIYVGKTFRETKKRPLYLVRSYSGAAWSRTLSGKV
jgi:glycosyltransferase involved in cell wall biosynthesis